MPEPSRRVSHVLIRDATPADFDRLLEINEANVPEVGPLDAERLAFLVDESAIALVVVDDDDRLAGFCIVLAPGSSYASVNYRWFMDRYDDALYLDRVAFDAASQGRGLGRALYAEVERRMAADFAEFPVLTLEVNVDPPNEPSLRFHRRQGFVEVGRQTYGDDIEVSLMARSGSE